MSSNSMLDPIVRALVGVDPVHHGVILDAVNKLGGRDATTVRSRIAKVLREPMVAESAPSYLTHLTSVSLAPTKGDVTIAEAKDVFTGYLDPDFKNWGTDVAGNDIAANAVDVHEVNRDGTFAQLWGSLGDPQSLCLTQGQIVEFCRSNRDQLRQGGCATLFLFMAKGELFVAYVDVRDVRLKAYVRRFGLDYVWVAEYRHRVVVPQQ
jgi:hypothetical protein